MSAYDLDRQLIFMPFFEGKGMQKKESLNLELRKAEFYF
jgi:hypothetical protein